MTNIQQILAGLAALPELDDVALITPHVPDEELSSAEILALLGDWEQAMSARMDQEHWGANTYSRLWQLRPMPLPGMVVGL